jgi:hypothetical protein
VLGMINRITLCHNGKMKKSKNAIKSRKSYESIDLKRKLLDLFDRQQMLDIQ